MDTSTGFEIALVLVTVLVLGALTFSAAYRSRHRLPPPDALPLLRFLRRRGVTQTALEDHLGTASVVDAERRCALCGSGADCHRRVAEGKAPPEHCPNTHFLARNC